MEFAEFARRAAEIEGTDADGDIVEEVAALFANADGVLPIVVRFVQGRVFPAWTSQTLDVGPNYCYAAIARAAGPNVDVDDIEDRLAEAGDIGAVAADFDLGGQTGLDAFGTDETTALTVREVFDTLDTLSALEGDGSQDRKIDHLFSLFTRCSPVEARILARLVLGEMRIGVGEGLVRDAIGVAFLEPTDETEQPEEGGTDDRQAAVMNADDETSDSPSTTLDAFASETAESPSTRDDRSENATSATAGDAGETTGSVTIDDSDPHQQTRNDDGPSETTVPLDAVERALQVSNDYGLVAERARDGGIDALSEIELTVGRPVKAMLAQSGTVSEAVEDWDAVAAEIKYDGARVQVHHDGTDVELFSRNMESVTDALPEVVEAVEANCRSPAILDGEVVAIDENGDPLPFQEVLRRFRRKHDVAETREDVAVEFRAFDCLLCPEAVADESVGRVSGGGRVLLDEPLSTRYDCLSATLEADVVEQVVTDDPETIESFEADALAAGHEGLMLKDPDSSYRPGDRGKHWRKRKPDVDTLDLVVTGAEWGEGRRANHLGTFEVSATDGDDYVPLGHVATGITDEQLAELTELLDPYLRSADGQVVDVEPAVVFEVGYEEIQRSPDNASGYALRFPRFVGVRPDKAPADADTLERVETLADR